MLLEPGAIALDLRKRVEVAEAVEHRLQLRVLAAVDRLDEGFEDLALGVGAGRGEDVVLGVVEDVERVASVVDAALQPPRRAGEDVLLAPAEEAEVILAVGQILLALCLLYTSPSPRDGLLSRMPSSA